MDAPITRAEHEEFRRSINTEFVRLSDEDNRQNHRIEKLEETVKEISALASSTEKLAVNMENMLKVQQQQGERLETLEGRDGEMWRKVVGYIITTIAGIVVGFIFTHLGM